MPALPGDRLTEAYRAAQVRNAAALALRLRQQFGGIFLDGPATASQISAFVDAAVPAVMAANDQAARQAQEYIGLLQRLEARGAVVLAERAAPPPEEAVRTSLIVTGPIAYNRRLDRTQSDPESARGKLDRSTARSMSVTGVMNAGIRHAQNGARDTVKDYVKADARARAWVRVTANDPRVCWMCAMLASRVNFKDGSFDDSDSMFEGIGTAKVHDGCRCHLRPIYGAGLPEATLSYKDAWRDLSGGPDDAATNFRRNWEIRNGVRKAAG